jgi:hypothetical protein
MDANTFAIFCVFLVAIAQFVALRSQSIPLRLMGAFSWLIPFALMVGSPPASIIKGGATDNIIMVVLIGLFLIQAFWAFRKPLKISNNYEDNQGIIHKTEHEQQSWNLPSFMKPGMSEEQQIQEMHRERREKLAERRERFRAGLRGPNDDDQR